MENQISKTSHIEVSMTKPTRVLHFSDGIEEEIEAVKVNDLNAIAQPEETVDPKTLPWGPWLSHYAWKSGSKVLDTVDYVGETLADFLGITTPKYQLEISEYERLQEEKKKMEGESAGWTQNNSGGDIPLVMNEPTREMSKINIVE